MIAGAWVNQVLYQAMWQRMAGRMDLGVNDSRTFRADAHGEAVRPESCDPLPHSHSRGLLMLFSVASPSES